MQKRPFFRWVIPVIFGQMTQNSSPYLLIYITCGNEENARQIATTLVEEQLAACVNILMIKTRREVLAALRERVCWNPQVSTC